MLDHTYLGTPASKMQQKDLDQCLSEGFQVLDSAELSVQEAASWVRLRLEVEQIRRRLGIAVR